MPPLPLGTVPGQNGHEAWISNKPRWESTFIPHYLVMTLYSPVISSTGSEYVWYSEISTQG